jgi:hypothetical protein
MAKIRGYRTGRFEDLQEIFAGEVAIAKKGARENEPPNK